MRPLRRSVLLFYRLKLLTAPQVVDWSVSRFDGAVALPVDAIFATFDGDAPNGLPCPSASDPIVKSFGGVDAPLTALDDGDSLKPLSAKQPS